VEVVVPQASVRLLVALVAVVLAHLSILQQQEQAQLTRVVVVVEVINQAHIRALLVVPALLSSN
jgi:hypothetical protein